MATTTTIAVCTRNRPAELRRTLAKLVQLRGDCVDILVVDNAPSDDSTRAVAAEFQVAYTVEPTPGLSPARQRALTDSRRELIAYIDDDCKPAPGWIEAVVAAFADPAVGGVAGAVMSMPNPNAVQAAFQSYSCRCGGDPCQVTRKQVGRSMNRAMLGCGANMAFRRAALLAAGGFPPFAIAAEDDYIFFKVVQAGYQLRYEPSCAVYQSHRSMMREQLARFREYGRDEARMTFYISRRDRAPEFFVRNVGAAFGMSVRRQVSSILHGRWRHVLFECWHAMGLIWGTMTPHLIRETPRQSSSPAGDGRGATADAAGGHN